jgi:hypothetical protein
MNETDIRLLHLSHYPNQVRQGAYQPPYQAAPGARGGAAANGRSLRSWAIGLAVSMVAVFSLVQVL